MVTKDTSWDADPEHLLDPTHSKSLLRLCVGKHYGENPSLDLIRQERVKLAYRISDQLWLTKNDRVLEIGSGFGFTAATIAPRVKQVYCADISKDFYEFACHELKDVSNIKCSLIDYGDLSSFRDKGVTAIYASALFIHFNLYDIYVYLSECKNILKDGGRLWFDFKDADHFVVNTAFERHVALHRNDRRDLTLLQYNSKKAIIEIASNIGFQIAADEYSTLVLYC